MQAAIFLLATLLISNFCACAQQVNLSDANITFKDTSGNVIPRDSIFAMFSKYSVSMKETELQNGKKDIILIPRQKSHSVIVTHLDSVWVSMWLGKALPAFALRDINNKPVSLKSLEGKIAVFNFWYLACKPCVMEIPELNGLKKKYQHEDIIFFAPSRDNASAVQKFLKQTPFNYEVLADASTFANKLGINMYPAHIVLDRSGKIVDLFTGSSTNTIPRLEKTIKDLLKTNE